ncbi:hypothetical protein OG978_32470 [Streptomyces sp. NBC_01591]|uniref:hypothetical protein n=1 Tax=Streptomyces sp. NBC_01591 TaxID=2975888 RepID=UPI002DD8735C|nr:hypothetical protein [Streptomyces sp. NBC_01591]WSD71689.1 hypothetical protein OG978_32470 [Streptomyces sp. NBC_01591]
MTTAPANPSDEAAPKAHDTAGPASFFQPGHTYLRFVGDRDLYFRVSLVSTENPNRPNSLTGDGPVAYGWACTEQPTTGWVPTGHTNVTGWRDVTETPAAPATPEEPTR